MQLVLDRPMCEPLLGSAHSAVRAWLFVCHMCVWATERFSLQGDDASFIPPSSEKSEKSERL